MNRSYQPLEDEKIGKRLNLGKGKTLDIATLMDCAAGEMDRLRVGVSSLSRSAEVPSTLPAPLPAHVESSVTAAPVVLRQKLLTTTQTPLRPEERTCSTTGTLASLLHIQLAQLQRMAGSVRTDVSMRN